MADDVSPTPGRRASLGTVAREWGRIGITGFGGPPAHIALLRALCVERRRWFDTQSFDDAIAACNLLPGPASTQLAIYTAWTVAGPWGAVVGGLAFILPGLVVILALAAAFLAASPPLWLLGAAAGAGSAVAAVALRTGVDLARPSIAGAPSRRAWLAHALVGALGTILLGPWLVVLLLACGLTEVLRRGGARSSLSVQPWPVVLAIGTVTSGSLLAVAWVAFKVGALAYGGGFVIIPLMRGDAVGVHHWMTDAQFLDAVALGQVTPGPVVLTVAVVGAVAAVGGAPLP